MPKLIPITAIIEQKILLIRQEKVLLDTDLAKLYGVETKALVQAVKRHMNRFPDDFMFQLSKEEFNNLRSQFVTSSWGGRRHPPYAFTEQGVAMLSSVLHSSRAVGVNIEIMRTFVRLRQMLENDDKLRMKLNTLEQKYDEQFSIVFKVIRQLINAKTKNKFPIGFMPSSESTEK